MIYLRLLLLGILLFAFSNGRAQTIFWTEDFGTQTCAASQNTEVTSYSGINGTWTQTISGTQGASANKWFVSPTEAGFLPGTCGDGCLGNSSLTNKTLHVGCQPVIFICPSGDCGAAYNAGGLGNVTTNKRAESPAINCTGYSNITLSFNYIEGGEGANDDASVYYFDGSTWSLLANMPKTLNSGCFGQGLWTAYSVALPASANNNPNVKIGFLWVNNNNAAGTDPSFAVDNVTLSVTSAPGPVAKFVASDSLICTGQCINFTDLSTNNPTSWAWTFQGGTPGTSTAQNPTNICFNTPGFYSITLVATNGGGSGSLTKTNYIIVSDPPPVSVSPASATICQGDSVTLVASGASTYSWTPATGLNTTSGATVTAQPLVPITYTVTGTEMGCAATDTVFVDVAPAINPFAGNDTTICAGASVQLQASGGTGYSWTPATGLSCTNCSDPIATPSTDITYTVTVSSGSCSPATDAVTITVLPAIVADAGGDTTICLGQSVQLQASGGNNYLWSPITALSCTNCPDPVATPVTDITYTVTVSAGGCLPATDVVTVTVLPPVVADAGHDTTVCQGEQVQLQASGGLTYAWLPVTGLSCTDCPDPQAGPTTMTTYTVEVSNGYCSSSDTVNVFVDLPVSAGISAPVDTICIGDHVQLTATGGTSYVWSPGDSLRCTTCPDPWANPTSQTLYTVTVTAGVCPPATANITINVGFPPVADAGPGDTICQGETAYLLAGGGSGYDWFPASGLSCTNCNDPQATPAATTTYTVTVTEGACTASDVVTVNVVPLPNASAGNNVAICEGDSIQLNASGGSTYLWTSSSSLSCTSCQDPLAFPTATTTYTVTVSDGNCSASDDVTVPVNPIPVAGITGNTNLCLGNSTTLTGTGGASYEWNTGALTNTIIVNPSVQTSYTVTVTSAGCTDDASITLNVFIPEQVFAGDDTTILIGNSVQLNADGGISWNWSPVTGLSCTNCQSPVASPQSTTTYYVIAIDANGCQSTDDITITIDMNCGAVYIPTIFSPNGDLINDVLYVRGNCITNMDFTVFDRWGEKMFSSAAPADGWDGTFRGQDVENGVYVFHLKATLLNGDEIARKGSVSLIR